MRRFHWLKRRRKAPPVPYIEPDDTVPPWEPSALEKYQRARSALNYKRRKKFAPKNNWQKGNEENMNPQNENEENLSAQVDTSEDYPWEHKQVDTSEDYPWEHKQEEATFIDAPARTSPEEREAELNRREAELVKREIHAAAVEKLSKMGLPAIFADPMPSENDERALNRWALSMHEAIYNTVQEGVELRIRSYVPSAEPQVDPDNLSDGEYYRRLHL